ncbi:HAMP domain-containing histidine kinase [Irregularibacter muris]|uniref:histidine kinase n=1 Tax=Irregularibacter muris TaxID=1796619 RepID=A0AAE3HEB0_9FIRM|nr:HAMP domain-containing sensor histidine kinase [Irregularibacter muris]MCR1897905.1 HAMP domain-containing histidine kinase [Irregularibacter muris]
MGTKLRNISTHTITKIIAFILTIVLVTAMVLQGQYMLYLGLNPESLLIKEYKASESFHRQVDIAISQTISRLENPEGIPEEVDYYYYITDGKEKGKEITYTNAPEQNRNFFEKHENAFYALEKGEWSVGKGTSPQNNTRYYYPIDVQSTLYIAFPDEFMNEGQRAWQNERETLMPLGIGIIFCFALALLLIIYLFVVTGRKPQDKELYLTRVDHIYSDILIAALIPVSFIWLVLMDHIQYYNYMYQGLNAQQIYLMIAVGALTAAVSTIYGVVLLSLGRKIKAKKLIKNSFLYQLGYGVYDFTRSFFDGRKFEKYPLTKSLFYRQVVFIVTSAALVFFTFLFVLAAYPLAIFPPILEIAIIYWYIKGNNKTFEDINKGFNESLEEQMKSERMKINLVTNVSHDLKTPLTSIISYVDLLSKEEDLSQSARDYVKILSEKSNRLKQIVADLFDLAKSTSGDIHLDLETLDMKKLIEQTLGDMEDEIEKSGLQIKTKLPDKAVNVVSDGKKLYRVFQNVLDNALKYSHKGTRVYVELEEIAGKAIATIKNTAGYEMDFTPEEILQRFNRGDKSRSTEGSGLGLSIAESFTNVSGGNFDVQIDGDLFKVILSYSLV